MAAFENGKENEKENENKFEALVEKINKIYNLESRLNYKLTLYKRFRIVVYS